MADFSELLGKSIVFCDAKVGEKEINLVCSDGTSYRADVVVKDIAGNIEDILNSPVLITHNAPEGPPTNNELKDSAFYQIATRKGYVSFRVSIKPPFYKIGE